MFVSQQQGSSTTWMYFIKFLPGKMYAMKFSLKCLCRCIQRTGRKEKLVSLFSFFFSSYTYSLSLYFLFFLFFQNAVSLSNLFGAKFFLSVSFFFFTCISLLEGNGLMRSANSLFLFFQFFANIQF